ncbi:hypothetical protein [Sulfurimonas sp.]|uniref:hypothetical protein n=1 Tax=Sulfurimonas sp. TaxID=2022749 RepID=UPI00356B278A
MLKSLKNSSKVLLLAGSLALSPIALSANFIEGLSESSSAALEDPGFEKQLVRINTGINLIRINTDIIQNMPVSADSEWVDKVIAPIDFNYVNNLDAVKNDAYYSTVNITNVILGKAALRMSPLEARLFWQAAAIYKNSSNGNKGYKIPDMNVFPDVTDTKTYTSFKAAENDDKVALIDVEAKSGNIFPSVEEAVISLLPEDMIENVKMAKNEYREAISVVGEQKSAIAEIEAWLDDDANSESEDRAAKEEELKTAEAELVEKEAAEDSSEEKYFTLLSSGAEAVEANFDPAKIPLAKKLDALLDAVDNNAFGATSMFVSATAGIVRGRGMIDKEIRAMQYAQALTTLVGNQKQFIGERLARMTKGTLLAVPNIGIGTYYAFSQSSSIGKYQDIVAAVLAGEEASK